MSFLKNIFGPKDAAVANYQDFWKWFQKNEKKFFKVVKERNNIEKGFFDKLSTKLGQLKDGYFYLTGMLDTNTVELILTADGNIKNIAFVEELIATAPSIKGWKFTCLKPALEIEDVSIEMNGYTFSAQNLSFYANENPNYPDEIDINIVHEALNDSNRNEITNGVYIFLDNFLGELDFINNIDILTVIGTKEVQGQLIPITKLKSYLTWRQKEFVEKYDAYRYNTENDSYSMLEADLGNDNFLIAVINTELLKWDGKASHPWFVVATFNYDGQATNGMPNETDYKLLSDIEDEIMLDLKSVEGCLNVGRQTAEGVRELYFTCMDFRQPSKVLYKVQQKYADSFDMDYDIYKDKYWKSLERFNA